MCCFSVQFILRESFSNSNQSSLHFSMFTLSLHFEAGAKFTFDISWFCRLLLIMSLIRILQTLIIRRPVLTVKYQLLAGSTSMLIAPDMSACAVHTLNSPSEELSSVGRSHEHQQQPDASHLACVQTDSGPHRRLAAAFLVPSYRPLTGALFPYRCYLTPLITPQLSNIILSD